MSNIIADFYNGGFLRRGEEVLDLCCGIGVPFRGVWHLKRLVGVDIIEKYEKQFPGEFVQGELPACLGQFGDKSFDVVTCTDGIEHLEFWQADKLIKEAERIAKRAVFFFTPLIFHSNEENMSKPKCWAYGNPFNAHKSHWPVVEWEKRCYKTSVAFDMIYSIKEVAFQESQLTG